MSETQTILHPTTITRRVTRVRFGVLALIAVGTMINYLDRAVLSIAAPSLSHDLRIQAATMGLVFSAFSWSYAASQIPAGILLDRLGSRVTYWLSITLWSTATLLQSLATGLFSMLGLRLFLGIAEAPCFPANSRIVTTWFPRHERGRATSVYTVGEYLGLALFSPLLFWIMARFGWRILFLIVGLIGIVFGALWLLRYKEPADSTKVSEAELTLIAGDEAPAAASAPTRRDIGLLLRSRRLWGASIGQFAGNSTLVFFLTWFPTYLAHDRHMAWIKVGFFAILPFLAAACGVLAGGLASDKLLLRTGSINIARKLPIISGLLLSSLIIGANYVNNNAVMIAIMAIAFFGQGMVGLGWTVISDIAPKTMMGLSGGLFNFAANLAGTVTPIVVGFIVAETGSFVNALFYVGGLGIVGALSYIFLLGEIRRIEL